MKKILTLAMVAMSINAIAQKFEKQQPDILYAVDKDHDTAKVKVGIGVTNPSVPLEVFGNALFRHGNVIVDSLQVRHLLEIGGVGGSIFDKPNKINQQIQNDETNLLNFA